MLENILYFIFSAATDSISQVVQTNSQWERSLFETSFYVSMGLVEAFCMCLKWLKNSGHMSHSDAGTKMKDKTVLQLKQSFDIYQAVSEI